MVVHTPTVTAHVETVAIAGDKITEQLGFMARWAASWVMPVKVRATVTLGLKAGRSSELGHATRTVVATMRRGHLIEGSARVI